MVVQNNELESTIILEQVGTDLLGWPKGCLCISIYVKTLFS